MLCIQDITDTAHTIKIGLIADRTCDRIDQITLPYQYRHEADSRGRDAAMTIYREG